MNVLKVQGLSKHYRPTLHQLITKKDRSGVFDINISIDKGEVYGLLGADGAGKTTIIRTILGFVRRNKGKVVFMGKPNIRILNTLLSKTGYLPGEYAFYDDFSGLQFLKFMAAGRKVEPAFREHLTTALGFTKGDLKDKIWEYSTGQMQKLAIVAAMQHKPPFLVLDEPTNEMRMPERKAFYGLIDSFTSEGGAVLIASTSAPEVETLCNRVAVLDQGRILAEETPQTLRQRSIYNFAVNVHPEPDSLFFEKKGFKEPQKAGRSVHFQAAGDIDSLLRHLQEAGRIKGLELERACIEDVIRRFYAKGDKNA
jgi:ABC-2 type transport system ATP-binding protein